MVPFRRYNKVQICTFSFCTLGYCPSDSFVPYFFCMLTFWKFPFWRLFTDRNNRKRTGYYLVREIEQKLTQDMMQTKFKSASPTWAPWLHVSAADVLTSRREDRLTLALELTERGGKQQSVHHVRWSSAAGDARLFKPSLHPLRQPAQLTVTVQGVRT